MAVRNVPPANDYNASGSATGRRERSFAALYEQARKAAANDDQTGEEAQQQAITDAGADQNRKYIENLHERVDTLRGEIIVRVIKSSGQDLETGQATGDISRLSNRLDSLRLKLQTEQARLSGKLIDVNV